MMDSDDVSDEMLMALADAELPDDEERLLRDLIGRDAGLAARYTVFADSRALLQNAFPSSPMPDRLVGTILNTPTTAEDPPPTVLPFRRRTASPGWGMALAASILLAISGFWLGRDSALRAISVGPEAAAIALADTPTGLDVTLPDGSTARALGSYATEIGLCRLIDHAQKRHIVCRDDASEEWTAALSVAGAETDGFLPASETATGLIDQMLDSIGAGPALTPAAEEESLRR